MGNKGFLDFSEAFAAFWSAKSAKQIQDYTSATPIKIFFSLLKAGELKASWKKAKVKLKASERQAKNKLKGN